VVTRDTLCTFTAVLTIVAAAFVDNRADTKLSFDRVLNAPALRRAIVSPGVEGLEDKPR
jgi:hypothetical protein